MTAPDILRRELWNHMEDLEAKVAALPGVDPERIAAVAERAGSTSTGHPPRPRADDVIGMDFFLVGLLDVLVDSIAARAKASSARGCYEL